MPKHNTNLTPQELKEAAESLSKAIEKSTDRLEGLRKERAEVEIVCGIESRQEELDKMYQELESMFYALDAKANNLGKRIDDIEALMSSLKARFDALRSVMEDFDDRLSVVDSRTIANSDLLSNANTWM